MRFSLTFTSTARASQIQAFLSEPEKFVSVHPLIFRMEALPNGRFRVFERVAIGPIAQRFTYPATIEVVDGRVELRARVMGMVRVEMIFSFTEQPKRTLLREDVEIRTLLPIKRFMRWLIREQHAVMFANIERVIQGES